MASRKRAEKPKNWLDCTVGTLRVEERWGEERWACRCVCGRLMVAWTRQLQDGSLTMCARCCTLRDNPLEAGLVCELTANSCALRTGTQVIIVADGWPFATVELLGRHATVERAALRSNGVRWTL